MQNSFEEIMKPAFTNSDICYETSNARVTGWECGNRDSIYIGLSRTISEIGASASDVARAAHKSFPNIRARFCLHKIAELKVHVWNKNNVNPCQ